MTRTREKRIGASAEERFGTKHIKPVHFRGEHYPSHYEFYQDCREGDLKEWTRVGLVPAFLHDMGTQDGTLLHKGQVLVWTEQTVVAMSKDRFRKNGKRK